MISQSVLRVRIERITAKYKTQAEAAKAYGMTRAHLATVLGGAQISNEVAERFGYTRVERQFVKTNPAT